MSIVSGCVTNVQKERKRKSHLLPLQWTNKRSSDDDQSDSIGVASPADVSPNTPKADEADL